MRKISKSAAMWWLSCRIRPWTKNFQSYRSRIHSFLWMQTQQRWNRKVWRNSQLTVTKYIVKRNYFFFSQSHSGRSSSSSIIIGFKQILIFVSYNKFHYSRISTNYSFGSLLSSCFPLSWHTQKQLSWLWPWFVLSWHSLVCVGSSGSKKSGNVLLYGLYLFKKRGFG